MKEMNLVFNVKLKDMFEVCDSLREIYEQFDSLKSEKTIAGFFSELEAQYAAAQAACEKDSETPQRLRTARRERKVAWSRAHKVIEGYAVNALVEINIHGGAVYKLYLDTDALEERIAAFREQSKSEEMEAHIAALPGLKETLAPVYAIEDEIIALQAKIAAAAEEKKDKPTATDIKREMINIVNAKIIPYLRIQAELKPDVYSLIYRVLCKST